MVSSCVRLPLSGDDQLEAIVHADQEGLRVMLKAICRRACVRTEVHVILFEECRPVGREHVLSAAADNIAAFVVGELSKLNAEKSWGVGGLSMSKIAKALGIAALALLTNVGTAEARGGHGGGYRGGYYGGVWGWGTPNYYYGTADCGWVRVRVLRSGYWVVRSVRRCW